MTFFENNNIDGIGLRNYRSIGDTPVILDGLSNVNYIIGENNSGKSNLLRAFASSRYDKTNKWIEFDSIYDHHQHSEQPPSFILRLRPDRLYKTNWRDMAPTVKGFLAPDMHVEIEFTPNDASAARLGPEYDNLSRQDLYGLYNNRKSVTDTFAVVPSIDDGLKYLAKHANGVCCNILRELIDRVIYIPAHRHVDISGDDHHTQALKEKIHDGTGVIKLLRDYQTPLPGQEDKGIKYAEVRDLIRSLLNNNDIDIEVHPENYIIIIKDKGVRRDLRSFGTGLEELVVLCSSLALYSGKIFCIEEPELHLHPILQRRFADHLATTQNTYLIATHSNVLLDNTGAASVYHLHHDGASTQSKKAISLSDARDILDDIGYHASDILQSNGIVWVEGPSDRLYILKWIEIYCAKHGMTLPKEGIDYQIMFFGGSNISQFTATDEPDNKKIDLLTFNRNAYLVADSDRTSEGASLKNSLKRIL